MSMISKKICLIGDFGVGKTSLIRRFIDRQFSDQYLSTIGVKISRKVIEVLEQETGPRTIQLLIWDIEGRTKFQAITPSYVEGAQGAIIVSDLSRQDSVSHIQEHIDLVSTANPQGIPLILAFNKCDLLISLTPEQTEFIQTLEAHPQVSICYLTSAKTGQYVDEMFQTLAHDLLKHHRTLDLSREFYQ